MTDYRDYKLNKKQWLIFVIRNLVLFLVISILFYDSFWFALIGVFILPFLHKKEKEKERRKRAEVMLLEFKEFILSFSNGLKAGYSIENAFKQAYLDLQYLYSKESDFLTEVNRMIQQMSNNRVLEELLLDFANRSGLEDVEDFCNVFASAKRMGGNLSFIIQNTSQIISDKITVKEEIQLLISGKKFEQSLMNIIPIGIILYIRISSPGYFDPLYHNLAGICIMTVSLMIYGASFLLSEKIMDIEV